MKAHDYIQVKFNKWEGTYSITPTTEKEERYHLKGSHPYIIGKYIHSPLRDGNGLILSKERVVTIINDIPTLTDMNSEFVLLVIKHFRKKDATLQFTDVTTGVIHTLQRNGKTILHGDQAITFYEALNLIDSCYFEYHNLLKPAEMKKVPTFYDFIGKKQYTLKEVTRKTLQHAHELVFLQPVC